MSKILVLKDGDIHPTIEAVMYISESGNYITTSGFIYNANNILKEGDVIDEGDYRIASIDTDAIKVFGYDGALRTVTLENIEWCEQCEDFHVHLDEDDIDEYASGYADAIRDCVEYLQATDDNSVIRKALKKMNAYYMSDLDTDAKIAEFVGKRFEKKPQLTLDELKEIVGYDFDLV